MATSKIRVEDYPKKTKVEYGGIMYNVSLYAYEKSIKGSKYISVEAKMSFQNKRIGANGTDDLAALRALDKKINDIMTGAVGVSGKMTVARWAKECIEIYCKGNVEDATYADYLFRANRLANEIGKDLQLVEVSTVHCQRALNARQGMSGSEIDKEFRVLKFLFSTAFDGGLINRNPVNGVKKPYGEDGSHRTITNFEREHIVKVAKTHRAGLWVLLMIYTGLRPGEVIPLIWKDIDLKNRLIHVTKANRGKDNTIKSPKTAAGVRKVHIEDDLLKLLKEAQQGPFEPVFTQQRTGKRHTKTSFYKEWNSFKKALDDSMGAEYEKVKTKDGKMRNIKIRSVVADDLTPHCFRHTRSTYLVGKLDIRDTQYTLGHANVSVTADIYTHMTQERLDSIAGALSPKKKKLRRKKA